MMKEKRWSSFTRLIFHHYGTENSGRRNSGRFSDIVDVWLFPYDGPVSLETATTNEAAQIAWLDKKQIKELFDQGDFVDTLGYFFEEKQLGGA